MHSKYEAHFPSTGEILGHETNFALLFRAARLNCRVFEKSCKIFINGVLFGVMNTHGDFIRAAI